MKIMLMLFLQDPLLDSKFRLQFVKQAGHRFQGWSFSDKKINKLIQLLVDNLDGEFFVCGFFNTFSDNSKTSSKKSVILYPLNYFYSPKTLSSL